MSLLLSPIQQCVWYFFFYCSSLVDVVLPQVSATADRRALSAGLLDLFHQPRNVILSFFLFTPSNKLEFTSVRDDHGCPCFSASLREALNPETLLQDKLACRLNFPSRVQCGVMDDSEHTSGEPGSVVFQGE